MILMFASDADLLAYLERDAELRLDDLAQTLAAWPLAERRGFLDRWQKRHGGDSAERLRARLRAIWKARGEVPA